MGIYLGSVEIGGTSLYLPGDKPLMNECKNFCESKGQNLKNK